MLLTGAVSASATAENDEANNIREAATKAMMALQVSFIVKWLQIPWQTDC